MRCPYLERIQGALDRVTSGCEGVLCVWDPAGPPELAALTPDLAVAEHRGRGDLPEPPHGEHHEGRHQHVEQAGERPAIQQQHVLHRQRLGVDVEVMLMSPCMFRMENH